MKIKALIATVLLMTGASAHAAMFKASCVTYRSSLEQTDILPNGAKFTLDLSNISKEGDGATQDIGKVGQTPLSLEIYLSDKSTNEWTLQINEGDAKSKSILASTILNMSNITKLLYRSIESRNYILVTCFPEK